MELDYKSIGKRIRATRMRKGITQEHLAEIVDISPTHMSNIETGTTRVSLTTLVTIANALEVTCDDLLCESIVRARVQYDDETARLLADCDEYEIRIIHETIAALKTALRRDSKLRGIRDRPSQ